MGRGTRLTLYAVAVLMVVTPLAVLIALASVDIDSHRDRIAAELTALTGREVDITGPIEIELSLVPTLRVEGLRVANAEAGSQPYMLQVPRLELQVEALPLLAGELQLRSVLLSDAELLVERDAEGLLNWWLAGSAITGGPVSSTPAVALDRLQMERVTLRYRDAHGVDIALTLDDLTLVAATLDTPLAFDAHGELAGEPVSISAQLGTAAALLAGKRVATELRVELADARLHLDGHVPAAGEYMAARLSLEAPQPGVLLRVTQALLPALQDLRLPDIAPLHLSAELQGGDATLSLHEISLAAGDMRLSGNGSLSWRERTRIDADIGGELLDLSAMVLDTGSDDGRVFGEQPLPWSALSLLDADITLDLQRVRLGAMSLAPVRAQLLLDEGSARLTPELGAGGGTLGGEIRMDAGTRRLQAELQGRNVPLGELLASLGAGRGLSGAPAALDLVVDSRGESPRELAAAADGSLLIQVGAGGLPAGALGWLGGDLALTLARSLGLGGDDMRLECGVLNFALADGVLTRDDGIGFRFDRMNVVGGGSIDLGSERLDLQLAPRTREGVGLSAGSTLAGLVALRGTLSQPAVEVSGEGLARTGAKVGAAVVTGGLSLLASALWERITAESDVCAAALGSSSRAPSSVSPAPAEQPRVRPSHRDD